MKDARLTPANGRVAHVRLRGQVEAAHFVEGKPAVCPIAAADILGKPDGGRVSQLLYGEPFLSLDTHDGYAFGIAVKDGYCGYVAADLLTAPVEPTHWVCTPATHLYPGPDMKLMTQGELYLGSDVRVEATLDGWSRLSGGAYVPARHLLPIATRMSDAVDVAELYLGTPYLWGGNSRYGIDCSGLVQSVWRACGWNCPRDSDMQEASLGDALDKGAILQRGDLVFWKGHVGLMTSAEMLLHANAHHMAVAHEPLAGAVSRIEASGGGKPTCFRRA